MLSSDMAAVSFAPGDWSVIEIVCHLRDATQRALERMRQMRDQEDPLLPGYDQEAWASERNYASANLHEALAALTRLQQQQTDELAALSPEQWKRTGRHTELGEIDILTHTIHIVSHEFIHAAQLAGKRGPHVP